MAKRRAGVALGPHRLSTPPLTPQEFRLLRLRRSQPGRVFGRAQLLDVRHDDFRDASDRAIDSHIKNLRRKIAAVWPDIGRHRVALYGAGYRFDLPDDH